MNRRHTSFCANNGPCWCKEEKVEPVYETVSEMGPQSNEEGLTGGIAIHEEDSISDGSEDRCVDSTDEPHGDNNRNNVGEHNVATIQVGLRVQVKAWATTKYIWKELQGLEGKVTEIIYETQQAWVALEIPKGHVGYMVIHSTDGPITPMLLPLDGLAVVV